MTNTERVEEAVVFCNKVRSAFGHLPHPNSKNWNNFLAAWMVCVGEVTEKKDEIARMEWVNRFQRDAKGIISGEVVDLVEIEPGLWRGGDWWSGNPEFTAHSKALDNNRQAALRGRLPDIISKCRVAGLSDDWIRDWCEDATYYVPNNMAILEEYL